MTTLHLYTTPGGYWPRYVGAGGIFLVGDRGAGFREGRQPVVCVITSNFLPPVTLVAGGEVPGPASDGVRVDFVASLPRANVPVQSSVLKRLLTLFSCCNWRNFKQLVSFVEFVYFVTLQMTMQKYGMRVTI